MDRLTLTIVLSLFNPYINITSQKFSSIPFHLLFIILYSSPPCGSTPILPGYLLLRRSCTWDKTPLFFYRVNFLFFSFLDFFMGKKWATTRLLIN